MGLLPSLRGIAVATGTEQKPAMTSQYAAEFAKLLQAFGERFQNMKGK